MKSGAFREVLLFKGRKGSRMQVLKIRQEDEFIKLGQAIKAAGLVGSGVEAKIVIQNGDVLVNGSVETQRGKKLVGGETISFNGEEVRIER